MWNTKSIEKVRKMTQAVGVSESKESSADIISGNYGNVGQRSESFEISMTPSPSLAVKSLTHRCPKILKVIP